MRVVAITCAKPKRVQTMSATKCARLLLQVAVLAMDCAPQPIPLLILFCLVSKALRTGTDCILTCVWYGAYGVVSEGCVRPSVWDPSCCPACGMARACGGGSGAPLKTMGLQGGCCMCVYGCRCAPLCCASVLNVKGCMVAWHAPLLAHGSMAALHADRRLAGPSLT